MQSIQEIKEALTEIKYIPPKISKETIADKVLCPRPVRAGGPVIGIRETESGQLIIDNYGHGGAGWTMLYESAYQAVDLLIKKIATNPEYKNKFVTIIGSGAMGLMCAFLLQNYKEANPGILSDICIITKEEKNIPSYNAGGFWGIPSFSTDNKSGANQLDLATKTFAWFMRVARGKEPLFSAEAVELQDYIIPTTTHHEDVDYLIEQGLIMPSIPVKALFNESAEKELLRYQTIYINTGVFMNTLRQFMQDKNIPIISKDCPDLDSIQGNKIVFNCAGLEGAKFNPNDDVGVKPIYGHLIKLKKQNQDLLDTTLWNKIPNGFQDYIYKEKETLLNHLDKLTIPDNKKITKFIDLIKKIIEKAASGKSLFDDNKERVTFFYIFANVIRNIDTESPIKEKLMEFYKQIIPKVVSRYMMVWEGIFLSRNGSEYKGISYYVTATEQLPKDLINQEKNEDAYFVGKMGGTAIAKENYDPANNDKEFLGVLDRASIIFNGRFFSQVKKETGEINDKQNDPTYSY